jgi:hypothetical protein
LIWPAGRYCEAIAASLKATKVPSPSHTLAFVNQLRELSERISGTGAVDKTGSWISRTVAKPSLDGLGSWFEGRITKFVAGEGEDSTSAPSVAAPDASQQVGPFSHYAPVSAWSSDAGANDYTSYTPAAAPAPDGGDYLGYAAPTSSEAPEPEPMAEEPRTSEPEEEKTKSEEPEEEKKRASC